MKDRTVDEADDFVVSHLEQSRRILELIDVRAVTRLVRLIAETRAGGGRLFLLGVGGSAANCSHAVNDFRKLCGLESYAPTDNVSELTARINDEGWAGVFAAWLQASRLNQRDMVFIMSVGGGDLEKNVSPNLVEAIKLAKTVGAKVGGIVGRDGGYTARVADACVIIPPVAPEAVTPHTEAFQAVIWHLLVSHPLLKTMATKWESVAEASRRDAKAETI
jgi:D-sedoheptulose 7-phosphate isomerase